MSTYEKCILNTENGGDNFSALDEGAAVQFIIDGGIFTEFENPVSVVALLASDHGYKSSY